MKLVLDNFDPTTLGLAANASAEEITQAVVSRLSAAPPSAAASSPAVIDHDLIAAAVRDERIPASRADHYAQRYADDPDGTRKLLARLQPGSAHYANNAAPDASADDSFPAEWLPASRVAPWPRPVPGASASRVTVE